MHRSTYQSLTLLLFVCLVTSACQPSALSASARFGDPESTQIAIAQGVNEQKTTPQSPPLFATRPAYQPGDLVDYIAQTGDTLPALAAHFNTKVDEIRKANPFIPGDATTMPPGMPMKIPIYYLPFWGNPYQIIPDSLFINGPAGVNFSTQEYVNKTSGWLKSTSGYVSGDTRTGAQIVELVALNYSVSPRLLLALLEYTSGALTKSPAEAASLVPDFSTYPLGYFDSMHQGLYMQLGWAANQLNNSFYAWRIGTLRSLELLDGRIERPDPWQNAATVALQTYFSRMLQPNDYERAISPDGFAKTYLDLFGDPWSGDGAKAYIPGSLKQPEFKLPFQARRIWAFTGGPHTGWGEGDPLSAIDFAPPSVVGGCNSTEEWATAVAPGVVARSEPAIVVLDLDGDGDERTGWVVFYLHLATDGRASLGAKLNTGDPVGHPSCEGGRATGTHVHIARKYNGEWVPADGPLAFNMENWIVHNGAAQYKGTLTRFSRVITACECSDNLSQIESGAQP